MTTAERSTVPPDGPLGPEALRLLAEQMPAVLWTTDTELRFTAAMGAGLSGIGTEPVKVLGMSVADYFQSDTPGFKPLEVHRRALAGQSLSFETDWRGRSFLAHVEPLRDSGGNTLGVIGVALDITERKKVEVELKRSLALLQATLDATADGILAVDENGRILSYNRKFVEMWRLPPEVIDSGVRGRIMAYAIEQLKDPGSFVKRVMELEARPTKECSDTIEFKDGRIFERFSKARTVGGANVGRVWSFRDVTEEIRLEERAALALSLLHATMETTADGILVVDREGKIVSFNQRFVDLWGIPDNVLASGDDSQAVHFVVDQLRYPEKFVKKIQELYAEPESQSFDWLEFKDGRMFERYSQPQKLGAETIGRIWSFRDVSARRRLEERLRELEGKPV